ALSGMRIASVGRADHGSGEDADPTGVAHELVVFQLRLRLVVADDPIAGLAFDSGGGAVRLLARDVIVLDHAHGLVDAGDAGAHRSSDLVLGDHPHRHLGNADHLAGGGAHRVV